MLKKNKLIEKTIGPALKFLEEIKENDKIIVVHDDDCDGICSGVIVANLVNNLFGYFPELISTKWNESLTESVASKVLKENVNCVIIVDVPMIQQKLIDELKDVAKILIIDHHLPEKYKNVVYCNPRLHDKKIYIPVSYVVYKVYEVMTKSKYIMWVAATGVLGDHGVNECSDIFEELRLVHPRLIENKKLKEDILFNETELGLLAKIIDSGRVMKGSEGAEFVARTLLNVKNYREVLDGSTEETKILLNWYKTSRKEFDRLVEDFKKNKKLIGKNILFYEFKSKLRLKSTLASSTEDFCKDSIVVIGQEVYDYFDVSIRKGEKLKINLVELVKRGMKNIPGARGGGHPEAVGAKIPLKYKEKFLENLAKN